MKTITLIITILSIGSAAISQSIERDVVASAGDYFEAAGISVSSTIGEIASETYSTPNLIITQGFQQPDVIDVSLVVDLSLFLEGPYSGPLMSTNLNMAGNIPLSQPYNTAPWFYTGTEAVAAMPNSSVVDWILIELRDAPDAVSATSATMIARKALFILSDGTVTDLDGASVPQFSATVSNNLFTVVWHRNHIGIMSANALVQSGGVYTYDFSAGMGQVYGAQLAHKEIATGVWGMIGGDADADEQINNIDKNDYWAVQAGLAGYLAGDFNMDNQVNNSDKIDVWNQNTGLGGQVPDTDDESQGVPD